MKRELAKERLKGTLTALMSTLATETQRLIVSWSRRRVRS